MGKILSALSAYFIIMAAFTLSSDLYSVPENNKQVASVISVDYQNYSITAGTSQISRELYAGDKLFLKIDESIIYIKVHEMFQNLTRTEIKCRVEVMDKQYISRIKPGMPVYKETGDIVHKPDKIEFLRLNNIRWQLGEPKYLVWSDAMKYCEDIGMRLPTIVEWRDAHIALPKNKWDLLFFGSTKECLDKPCYWSSTEKNQKEYNIDAAYYFYNNSGDQYMYKTYNALVRCVSDK
jgi:hypothetical protein